MIISTTVDSQEEIEEIKKTHITRRRIQKNCTNEFLKGLLDRFNALDASLISDRDFFDYYYEIKLAKQLNKIQNFQQQKIKDEGQVFNYLQQDLNAHELQRFKLFNYLQQDLNAHEMQNKKK